MIDGNQRMQLLHLPEHIVHGGNRSAAGAKIYELGRAEYICVTFKRCYFASGDDQEPVEIGLQFPESPVVRC